MIAEELKEAEKLYPAEWIESAFKEAVTLNKRSWRYIARILERWAIEGKDDGKPGRDFKKEDDREKYIRGKYGHMVKAVSLEKEAHLAQLVQYVKELVSYILYQLRGILISVELCPASAAIMS